MDIGQKAKEGERKRHYLHCKTTLPMLSALWLWDWIMYGKALRMHY